MRLSLVIKKENVDLEKQVNKLNNYLVLNKSIRIALTVLILGSFTQVKAQERVPFDQGKKYILGDVTVVGDITFNTQTVVTFAGLQKGQSITIPGEQISSAIKKLGKLGLFDEISFYINRIENDSIYLDLNIVELPKLSGVKFVGVKKSKTEALIKDNSLNKGKVVNENLITTTKNYIENKYKKDGYYNTKVNINTAKDTATINQVNMVINVDKGNKVKIQKIDFVGNTKISDKVLRKAMKDTKQKNFLRVLKGSKFIKEKYKSDLENVIASYKEKGYRDARILSDSVTYDKDKKALMIKINVEEGNKYFFGNIKFLGNTVYPDQYLNRILGVKKGETYNGVLLEKRIADKSKPDGEDITNLYQNSGYLFSNINAVEVRTANDTIDFEIRVTEGPIAYFNKITVVGNDKTNDRVIYRELRTKPGEKYSKEELVRTIREIGQLGFFDPEAIDPKFKNVDSGAGTVDIEYNLVEKGSSQIELQGGYGGGGFIGTLGLSFNNFSARNLLNKEAYKPLPMGDGQKVSLRLQASTFFQTYSVSFSEPWFGGKKPVSFSTSLSYSKQFLNNFITQRADKSKSFNIITLSVGLSKRLTVPDDNTYLSQSVSYQHYDLNNYNTGLFTFGNGSSRNLAYTIGLTHTNKGFNPIFPTYGSEFSLTAKFTPPYSLLNGIDYATLGDKEEYKLKNTVDRQNVPDGNGNIVQIGDYIDTNGNKVTDFNLAATNISKVDQERFKWLEYYKIKFKADWYTKIYGKLVLRTLTEFGFLGAYNQDRGSVPFERFYLGGDGLANFSMDGRETIQLRGYPNNSLTPVNSTGDQIGATVFNKFSMELRYPITLKSSASIYALAFMEAGSSFSDFKSYNPFALNRSAGVGLRVFMPAFGLLGIDFGHGFDALPGQAEPNGWETHFIIGQQF
ncbi:outer membrane protein assembly factor BamA [Flavobacterium sp. GSP27]|uniref:Outer membrane protein assembly factor BamA n=1 Tax=Flavobacterium bomense TaxID=2497483 RepID=A0A432CIP3_9FLAO|nr:MULTISPECIES: POTRA domain-containing protein [Flavobacterium]RTY95653.1 outer membrane protein assembly factor BamA [Flavobacterium sp. GSN2]RTY71445.1 outer membrane protein assembly factor BamA [Flavobacterium sp. LB2P53]RTY76685.1 outer membrane protein assembly factor BamA [Flavobacterium sp. LS1R10]RTY84226.1 outer membrane protein assembly factor BamA [Flavobacterium sp. LS1P28]RTZ03157.1 outer membrane protein assembly factor BamA [Flavobacterium bomense]